MKGHFAAWGEGEDARPRRTRSARTWRTRRRSWRLRSRAPRAAVVQAATVPVEASVRVAAVAAAHRRHRTRPTQQPGSPADCRMTGSPAHLTVTVDRDEIIVVGELPALTEEFADDAARAAAESGRITRFREDTREQRIEIARQGQHRYGRDVSWGARLGGTEELFTTLSAPVMTRLRQPERQILDTLVDSGVARSRSDAVVWAVRLVGQNADSWLGDLRNAMEEVNRLRNQGPDLG